MLIVVLGLLLSLLVWGGVYVSNGAVYVYNETSDLRGSVFLKVFDLARWWDLNYSSVLVRASVGAEWRFNRVEGALLDYALFWEDCSYCDSASPPRVKNRDTLYEDLILRVTYVGGRWVVRVLWGQGGFSHEVYVNGSLLYRKPPGYAGEPGVSEEYVGVALEVRIVSLGDAGANAAVFFTAFDPVHEALACAAALGLDAGEVNGLLRHLGLSSEVERMRREGGGVVFLFKNGTSASIPLVFDVDVGQWGRFVLLNPCGVSANWTLRLYVDNKMLGSNPGGREAGNVVVDMAPYSVAPVYVFGVTKEAGLYHVSYRLYVRPGVYDVWGYRVEINKERLVTANGSIVNYIWGFSEELLGKVWGDKCVEARGAGRRWAAEQIGWAGVATEVDAALGGAALFFSAGIYGAGRTAARGAAEVVKTAGEVARGYRAVRAVGLLYNLWQGALLGWDAYLSVNRGEVPLEAVGVAVAAVGGRPGERVRLLYGLASGGLLIMHLGEAPEMEGLVSGLYEASYGYGEYTRCFVDGALGAFDTYVKEVLANQLVGVVSIAADINSILNNKWYKGYLQLAAHAAYEYRSVGPIFRLEKRGGREQFIMFGKEKVGVNTRGELSLYGYRRDRSGYLVLASVRPAAVTMMYDVTDTISLAKVDVGDQSRLVAVKHHRGKVAFVGYNDAYLAYAVTRALRGEYYDIGQRRLEVVGEVVVAEVRAVRLENLNELHDIIGGKKETLVKYFWGAVAPYVYNVEPHMVGFEVNNVDRIEAGVMLRPELAEVVGVGESRGVRVYYAHTAFDILAVDNSRRLVIVEIERRDLKPAEFGDEVAPRVGDLLSLPSRLERVDCAVRPCGRLDISPNELLGYLVLAFNGAGPQGSSGVGGVFGYYRNELGQEVRPVVPVVAVKKGDRWTLEGSPVVFSLVLYDDTGLVVSYTFEMMLPYFTGIGDFRRYMTNLFSKAKDDFKDVERLVAGMSGEDIQLIAAAAASRHWSEVIRRDFG